MAYGNTQRDLELRVMTEMAGLSQDKYNNFNKIIAKYPNLSKDLVMSMVNTNMTVDTPGIEKITSLDGINQLKSAAQKAAFDTGIKPLDMKSSTPLGTQLSKPFKPIYEPLKAASRAIFATARMPYEGLTVAVRDAQNGKYGSILPDIFSTQTTAGSLLKSELFKGQNADAGNGFFVDTKSPVGQMQATAMKSAGTIGNDSYTLGRYSAAKLGLHPATIPYKVLSGITDAFFNIITDPLNSLGKVSKLAGGGKTLARNVKVAQTEAVLSDAMIAKAKSTAKDVAEEAKKKAEELKLKERNRYDDSYLAAEKDYQLAQQAKVTAQELIAKKALKPKSVQTTFVGTGAEKVLSPANIVKHIIEHPKAMTGELTDAINTLSADVKNQGDIFANQVHMDTLPEGGKISIGANGDKELFVTRSASKFDLTVKDLNETFTNADPKIVKNEILKRADLLDAVSKIAKETTTWSTHLAAKDMSTKLADLTKLMTGPINVGKGGWTLSKFIQEVNAYKDPLFTQLFSESLHNIYYNVDAWSNTRSIYGGKGGYVITPGGETRIATRQAKITDAIAQYRKPDPSTVNSVAQKLVNSVEPIDKVIKDAKNNLYKATKDRKDLNSRLKDIDKLQNYAKLDPELAQRIVNDPNNIGLKGIIDLNLKHADSTYTMEYIRAEMGLLKEMGSSLSLDGEKAIRSILGRYGDQVAEITAPIKDPVAIHNLYGKKLEADIVNELVKASTPNEVKQVFLRYLANNLDIEVAQSMALKAGAFAAAPTTVSKLVAPVSLKAIDSLARLEKAFNLYYVRAGIYNLDDTTALVNGWENWVTSISKLKSSTVIGKMKQDDLIHEVQTKLFASMTKAERSQIIEDGTVKLTAMVADALGIKDKEVFDQLKQVLKISGKDKIGQAQYSVNEIALNKGVGFITQNGREIKTEKALMAWQLLDDTIKLPDTRQVEKFLINYKANKSLIGKAKSLEILAQEAGDYWRTAQLAFRVSFILRNVGEMQVRQYLGGHTSILSNPFQFLSMVIANPEGSEIGKQFAKIARYQYDAYGNPIKALSKTLENPKVKQTEVAALQEYQKWAHRSLSAGDYRQGPRQNIVKNYSVTRPGDSDYYKGLSFTLGRAATDQLSRDVAKLIFNNVDEAEKSKYLDNLISTFKDTKIPNPLRDIATGVYRQNNDLMNLIFKNPKLEGDKLYDPLNLNRQDIYDYFFNDKKPFSIASELQLYAGTGPKSNIIKDILQKGYSIVADSKGKETRIAAPVVQRVESPLQLEKMDQEFSALLSRHLKPEDIKGSQVLVPHKSIEGGAITSTFRKTMDSFFQLSTKMENVFNFAPEYQQTYWSYWARYSRLLSNKDFEILRKNAIKALAGPAIRSEKTIDGVTANIIRPIGRKHPILKQLDAEYKERIKPGYEDYAGASFNAVNNLASAQAGKRLATMFYDAHNQRQIANSWRLVFPFAQAQFNTLAAWGKLAVENPTRVYRFEKAYNALLQPGSSTPYDLFGMPHDSNQGFFYSNPGDSQHKPRFMYPGSGNIIGALASGSISGASSVNISSPLSSLNVATGQVNPLVPGIGPAISAPYVVTGMSGFFGKQHQFLKNIIQPFGNPSNPYQMIIPAWLNKGFLYAMGDQATVQTNAKDWASYLASTGQYGTNPLVNITSRNALFQDAEDLARGAGFWTAIFQNILPSTPSADVLASFKTPEGKVAVMQQAMLQNDYQGILKMYPGDSMKARQEFANTYGIENILITMSGTTRGATRGSAAAWNFLNDNPKIAPDYSTGGPDVIPYFFPGADYSSAYYNWQTQTGVRKKLTVEELKKESASLVYKMRKSKIVEDQISNNLPRDWYVAQIQQLNKEFGGATPPETLTTGNSQEALARVGRALNTTEFQSSPVYNQTKEFYDKYMNYQNAINTQRVSITGSLKTKDWQTQVMRQNLLDLADKLIQENPLFQQMYYGVFYSNLKVK